MGSPASWVVVGPYNGGTSNNATVLDHILEQTGTARTSVRAVGLDTPGPASADGIISSKGATNFSQPAWHGFDVRGALEARRELPAVYAHHVHFGPDAGSYSSAPAGEPRALTASTGSQKGFSVCQAVVQRP